ncbi:MULTISPECIES: D-TA family PLP-dependent enzyme [unclassified Rhizobium]|uniref:D-TA family PLP-dependent enzyme n=1 Tax=unclassified Rhizobium TaxID=2613769 RepID=UPI00161831C8|nr:MULTISPECIES: D-TA family PLP-dependent enzyme [unclassified Rhizobium]MBB3318782.1 D-serine deaminase-like pyridoxal phosphate-dependent protein [Rhizobium sp. BK181]MBB3543115.1 D-serine deaminase-like pyridoxal phosphate-dependent protein [Rhizobium sp. BK399]MCS3742330.1 D-serine deaminase-like pyridoxal phosphate-dependent protein [Rhizobium sp. BK661]MCS4094842.1 D-serine deaminase-like pyridoxal phosphate-dependent protein [Rhizobium sp. BK176]
MQENPFAIIARPGDRVADLSTPRPIIDEDRLAANIARTQAYMDEHGLNFRPHIKTHKIPALAAEQIAAGAKGINCQKISEAEVFAAAGFQDILITFNILGPQKLKQLAALNDRISDLKVVADSTATVDGLSAYFASRKPLTVLVECDTGGGRCGVQTPDEARDLAKRIHSIPGLSFGGLLNYPKPGAAEAVQAFLGEALSLLEEQGIDCPIVSNGGTPSLFEAHLVSAATEHRAGTYIYNDRAMVRAGHCSWDDCAMHVLATVVSRPTGDRAVIDAGSKALTSDLLGFSDFGTVVGYPEAVITGLSEEHGVIDLSKCGDRRPEIGDKIRIIPNHTCVVSNLFDTMVFHRDGVVTRVEDVAARGLVW